MLHYQQQQQHNWRGRRRSSSSAAPAAAASMYFFFLIGLEKSLPFLIFFDWLYMIFWYQKIKIAQDIFFYVPYPWCLRTLAVPPGLYLYGNTAPYPRFLLWKRIRNFVLSVLLIGRGLPHVPARPGRGRIDARRAGGGETPRVRNILKKKLLSWAILIF